MSRLIMWNLMSLDGDFEGTFPWDLGWHQLVVDEEFNRFALEQLRSADRLLFGRVTYEGMAGYWPTAQGENREIADLMNGLPKFVFTRTGKVPEWANTTAITGHAATKVRRLKQQGDRNSFVFGSADLCAALMARDLFDEYRVLIAPLVLGSGTPLFKAGVPRQGLRLLEARTMSSGGVLLRYEPLREG